MPVAQQTHAPRNVNSMADQELTTHGVKPHGEGRHWLYFGQNATFCVENLSGSEIVNEQVRLWLESQAPVSNPQ